MRCYYPDRLSDYPVVGETYIFYSNRGLGLTIGTLCVVTKVSKRPKRIEVHYKGNEGHRFFIEGDGSRLLFPRTKQNEKVFQRSLEVYELCYHFIECQKDATRIRDAEEELELSDAERVLLQAFRIYRKEQANAADAAAEAAAAAAAAEEQS